MLEINTLILVLGWMTLINLGMLAIAGLSLVLFKEPIVKAHSQLLGIHAEKLPGIYFNILAHYKLAIIMLNAVPYLTLKIIS